MANWQLFAPVIIPIVIALLTIAGAYFNNARVEMRKAKIAFVNDQLKSLYGPLYSLSQSSETAWIEFRRQHRPTGAFFDPSDPPTADELVEWRRWMTVVFGPMNENMARAIVDHSDLIEGSEMPPSFLALIAHVEGYRVIFDSWEQGDFSRHTSSLNFPVDFQRDVERSFNLLKKLQMKLMGSRIDENT